MLAKVIAALVALNSGTAAHYADLIRKHGKGLDPYLVAAVVYVESRFRNEAKSHTNDYGLAQLHVSVTTNPSYRGRESLLFDPDRNLRIGTRMLRLWRRYHHRRCGSDSGHHWINHYQQGVKVRSRHYERAVIKIRNRARALARRFRLEV